MKILIEIKDKDFNDYALTEFEKVMDYLGIDYSLKSDDSFIQNKFGQDFRNEE